MTLTTKRLAEEEAEIRRALDGAGLPPSVVEYRLTLGEDWTGDPAVFIYFILSDDLTEKEFLTEARGIRHRLLDLLPLVSERIHYANFRTKSEQDAEDTRAGKMATARRRSR